MTSAAAVVACLHCGTPAYDPKLAPYCCTGCRAVHALLTSEHLERYYELRGEGTRGVPVADARGDRRDTKWLDLVVAKLAAERGAARVDLDVQGLHCSACVWLMDTVFARARARGEGALQITVNPSLGRVHLLVRPDFDLRAFVTEVERFGYLFGPPLKNEAARGSSIVTRMGICIAIAMNTMIFGIAIYAGLDEGPIYVLFQRLNLALSFASVVIGGSVFFRSAWMGLRRGVLHLDLPIALGILLAFGGSVFSYAAHRGNGIFVDTLNVFIALMLVGRWLQERVLEKNRLALLANDGALGLLARRMRDGRVETVRCTELREGDPLLIAPGDLVPIDATLEGDAASFSLDWINGESRAHTYAPGDTVPAGAFLAGTRAARVVTRSDFEHSPLLDLLRTPRPRAADAAMSLPFWQKLARLYVVAVLLAAAGGFALWYLRTGDVARAVEVTTAVLIVTCPCAFGIATPLAYDLVQAGLRRAGLFVRSPGFLDRAAQVRTVVFDKTGTLTSGALHVEDEAPLARLAPEEARILHALTASSSHPKSIAIHRALEARGVPAPLDAMGAEEPGKGVSLATEHGAVHRLGAPSWAAPGARTSGDVVFAKDGQVLADLRTDEALRPDAKDEVRALGTSGYDVYLLSGDESARAAQTARACGIAQDHAVGGTTAEAKAAWVAARDHGDLLMIGDGINDSLVVAQAFCSGTPAIDRPFMAARSDFYFVTPGLSPIRLALSAAKKLAHVRRRNLSIALAYNVLSIGLAYAGLMSPVVCAVFMPASSLTTILATTFSLSPRSRLWRS